MKAADISDGEKVEVLNVNNGQRIETYAIPGKPGTGVICLNGPASRGACVGDRIIILTYALIDEKELRGFKAKVIKVDARNRIKN